MTIQVHISDQM